MQVNRRNLFPKLQHTPEQNDKLSVYTQDLEKMFHRDPALEKFLTKLVTSPQPEPKLQMNCCLITALAVKVLAISALIYVYS